MIQNRVNLKKVRHRDFKTDVYYCLMGPKGQHEALKTSLAHKNSHLVTFLVTFVFSQGFIHTSTQDTNPIQVHNDYKSKHLLRQCTINCTFLTSITFTLIECTIHNTWHYGNN